MRMREVLKPLPDDNILIVTCGSLIGNLHRDRFFCPGIHRECIEVNGTFITPKRFSVMGEKARLKDWKNAVRLNGFQLRKYIDSGILKFSNHDSMCTGRCVARAPGARSGPAADSLLPSDSKSSATRPLGMFTTLSGNNIMKIEKVPSDLSWSYENGEEEEDVKPDVNQLQFQMLQAQNMAASKASTYVRSSPTSRVAKKLAPQIYPTLITPVPMVAPDDGPEDITEEDCEDRLLWKGIVELGLVDEFFREIKASLDALKNGMIKRRVPLADSRKISVIVKQLGLMQKLKYKLEAHQTDMERQRLKLDRDMEELQRKVREFEAKKALLKRKSECFEQLLDITAPKTESVWGEEEGSPSGYKRVNMNQIENEAGQLVVFPQQMSSVQNIDSSEMSANSVSAEDSVPDDRGHYVVNLANNESASSTNSYPEDLSKSASQHQLTGNTEVDMSYIITPAEDLSVPTVFSDCTEEQEMNGESKKHSNDNSIDLQGDDDSFAEAKYTGIKIKVRRGRKRKPREIPRVDPEEEFVIKMEEAMDEEGESGLNYATGSNDSPCDYANGCEEDKPTSCSNVMDPSVNNGGGRDTDTGNNGGGRDTDTGNNGGGRDTDTGNNGGGCDTDTGNNGGGRDTDTGLREGQEIPLQQTADHTISESQGEGDDLTIGTSATQDCEQITQSPCKLSFDFTGAKVNRRGRKRKSREMTREEDSSPSSLPL